METIEVATGEVKFSDRSQILRASALGSCIAIAVFDPQNHLGGMAHIMLPGEAPENAVEKSKYAANAIRRLFLTLKEMGALPELLQVSLAGGANVLQKHDDTICGQNIASVRRILSSYGITPGKESLGGQTRRTFSLNGATGALELTTGDGPRIPL